MKPWIIFCIILVVALAAGFICYNLFEIVPSTQWVRPSQEAQSNSFLALDRWLQERGHTLRIRTRGNLDTLVGGPEKTAYVEDSCFSWVGKEESEQMLTEWIQEGGNLFVSLNNSQADWRLEKYLDGLGIEILDYWELRNSVEEKDDDKEESEVLSDEESIKKEPSFDRGVSFKISEGSSEETPPPLAIDRITVMTDSTKVIRLITLHMGKGTLTITGTARFFNSWYLSDNRINAELISLLADPDTQSGGKGILFIRGLDEEQHLFGSLPERGDLRPLIIAVLALVVLGFWMVIPGFGRPQPVPERPGKPLRERFLAEGQFLKKYGALNKYLESYGRELEQRCRVRGIELPPHLAQPGNIKDMRAFMQYQREVMNILEKKETYEEKV
jgi:hypothetical protein